VGVVGGRMQNFWAARNVHNGGLGLWYKVYRSKETPVTGTSMVGAYRGRRIRLNMVRCVGDSKYARLPVVSGTRRQWSR